MLLHMWKSFWDYGKTTKHRPLIILAFKVFSDFFTFTKNSENYVEKHLNNGIEIEIAIWYGRWEHIREAFGITIK